MSDQKYKQIIIVRKDLNMSPGKMSAQVAHASTAFLTKMIKDNVFGEVFYGSNSNPDHKFMDPVNKIRIDSFDIDKGLYDDWINGEFTKVVLAAKNKNQLLKAKTLAEDLGMTENEQFFLIKDNCHTELIPEETDDNDVGRTLTCIGFVPMSADIIDQIGRKFHIYQ